LTHSSNPNSDFVKSHFSSEPATPTTLHPYIFPIWPTVAPTAPEAAETTIVSPF